MITIKMRTIEEKAELSALTGERVEVPEHDDSIGFVTGFGEYTLIGCDMCDLESRRPDIIDRGH